MTESAGALVLSLPDEGATEQLGAALARLLPPGSLLFLEGDLGMGKTTLARGLLRALGHAGAVKSPTYTLVEPYALAQCQVYHFDLYRLSDPEELEYMGIRDYFDGTSLVLVEWPERGAGLLPPADLVVTIETQGDGRRVGLAAASDAGRQVLEHLPAEPGIRLVSGVE